MDRDKCHKTQGQSTVSTHPCEPEGHSESGRWILPCEWRTGVLVRSHIQHPCLLTTGETLIPWSYPPTRGPEEGGHHCPWSRVYPHLRVSVSKGKGAGLASDFQRKNLSSVINLFQSNSHVCDILGILLT